MLIKVPTGDGRYRYALPAQENYAFTKERMRRIFNDTIIDCDYSENILVVKPLPGGDYRFTGNEHLLAMAAREDAKKLLRRI